MADTSVGGIVSGQHFKGFARVNLSALNFSHPLSARHRRVSEKKVSRLLRIFRAEGCNRDDEKHFVTGVVRDEQLGGAVRSGGCLRDVPAETWENVPVLRVESVACLNGWHRISAAKEYLTGGDRWWVIRIYTEGNSASHSP
jgi:hypothetical protein